MTTLRIHLQQIESRLQTLIEGGAQRLFPGRQAPSDLAQHLGKAMRDGILPGPQGEAVAPNLYTLLVHPDLAQLLQANRALVEELANSLIAVGAEAGLRFDVSPVVRVVAALDLLPGEIQVLAHNSLEDLPQTGSMPVPLEGNTDELPGDAFLIVDGTRIFTLLQPVINIGRRADNHLVVDDPRVSRLHAQLRLVRAHFVIFDLDSSGGTFVNGERVRQQSLQPGDVISLGGVPLVFGQEGAEQGETQDYIPGEARSL